MREGLRSSIKKRQRGEIPGRNDLEIVFTNVSNENALQCNLGDSLGLHGNSGAIVVSEVGVKEEIHGWNAAGSANDVVSNVADACVDVNGGDLEQMENVAVKPRRGRKRKHLQVSSDVKNEEIVVPVISARVLRSRTVAIGTNDVLNENGDALTGEVGKGITQVDKKKLKVELAENETVEPSKRGRKKKKGRRGRPPKVNLERGASDMSVSLKKARRGRPPKVNLEGGACVTISNLKEGRRGRSPKVNLEGGASVTISNLKKGRRGRPPKVKLEEAPTVSLGKKDEVVQSKKNKIVGSTKGDNGRSKLSVMIVKDPKPSKQSKQCMTEAVTNVVHKTGMRIIRKVSGVKNQIRNQIVEMLIRCGWSVQFVPRISKDYEDPVYVNPEGHTHWSITKAYRNLKERIESGRADAKEIAEFTVIPEEEINKLRRKTSKRRSDFGIKKVVGVPREAQHKNKSLQKKKGDSKHEDKQPLSQMTWRRKPRLVAVTGRSKKRFALLARDSKNGCSPDDDDFGSSKKCSLLSWMIDLGTVPLSAKVQYKNPTERVLLEGKVTIDGIRCLCCNGIQTVLGFESHAGSKLGQPLKNIYLESGPSLFQCLVDSWSRHIRKSKIEFCSVDITGDDPNDDTCNYCGDGGDLMCCDGCPSTFHQSCLGIENCPTGDWHCVYCACKFCGEASQPDDNDYSVYTTCRLCQEKFHITCIDLEDTMQEDYDTATFCEAGCQKVFNYLQELIGVRHEMDGGLSWTILQRYDVGSDASLSDHPSKVECNSKLAIAYSVMNECFKPIVDPRSESEMISNVIYSCGSNIKRLNYSGFYTIILERGDEVVTAAAIRIHGTKLAEMPFVATRNAHRRQGLCRRILTVIEKVLSFINIQKLVIPAISELLDTWTNVFGFMPLEETSRREMRTMSLIVFPGTDMLQKPLQQHQLSNYNVISAAGSESESSVTQLKCITTDPEDKALDASADGEFAEGCEQNMEDASADGKVEEGGEQNMEDASAEAKATYNSEQNGEDAFADGCKSTDGHEHHRLHPSADAKAADDIQYNGEDVSADSKAADGHEHNGDASADGNEHNGEGASRDYKALDGHEHNGDASAANAKVAEGNENNGEEASTDSKALDGHEHNEDASAANAKVADGNEHNGHASAADGNEHNGEDASADS